MTIDERRELYQELIDNLNSIGVSGIDVENAVLDAIATVQNK